MSTSRLPADAGYCDPKKLPRGPNGRALCRQCGTEVPPRRRTFCSAECVERWTERTDPVVQRRKVFARDGGKCQRCGLDVGRIMKRV